MFYLIAIFTIIYYLNETFFSAISSFIDLNKVKSIDTNFFTLLSSIKHLSLEKLVNIPIEI